MKYKEYYIKIDRTIRRNTGYYDTPSYIADFIVKEMLALNPNGKYVLEPAVGRECLVIPFMTSGISADGYDIKRYKEVYHCNFCCQNFLQSYIDNPQSLLKRNYDYIILNPPALTHKFLSPEYRQLLRNHFPHCFLNLFACFLSAVLDIAQDNCVIGAIVPDSILFSKSYQIIREKILKECSVTHLILCPEATFRKEGANFSACILIMRKGHRQQERIHVIDRLPSIDNFKSALLNREFNFKSLYDITIKINDRTIISPSLNTELKTIIEESPILSNCFTISGGVSTGDENFFTSVEKREGFSVPYYTNPASSRFLCEPNCWIRDDFLEIGKRRKNFIARNPHLFSREGIVCSATGKRFSACYLPNRGIVRTNASILLPTEDIYWLLAYLNSSFVQFILKGIISRSNLTTIGNVSSIPLPSFGKSEKQKLSSISSQVLSGNLTVNRAITQIEGIIEEFLRLTQETRIIIRHFCSDITHLV